MPVSYDLGTASGKVVIDFDDTGTKKATEGMDKVGQSADKLGKKTTDVQPLIKQTSTAFLTAGAIIAGALGLALKSATDFQFGLSAIQAVSGATASEMDLISKAALRIGADTKYNSAEAASAMEELLKAGISVTDVLNGAADATVSLAAAGEISLPEAAKIAAAAMNQFKLDASQVADVADIMAGAANASATGVSEIGAALTFVGPVANAAGLSLKDTALAIALFANNGIDGMRAGTGLRAMLSSLSSPTNLAAAQMEKLGLITEDGSNKFFDAAGKIKPFNEIAGLLRDTLGGLNEQQLLQFADAVVGRENMSTLSAIVNTSAEEFDNLATSIDSVSAADVAATRMQNLSGQVEILSGSVESLAIRFGQALLPAITAVTTFVNGLVDKLNELSDEQVRQIAGWAAVAAGALIFLGVGGKIVLGMMDLRKNILLATGATTIFNTATGTSSAVQIVAAAATRAWGVAMKALPIIAIIGLIAGLIAALVQMNGGWSGVMEAAKPTLDAVLAAFKPLLPVVEQLAGILENTFKAAVKALMPILQTLADTIFPVLMKVIEAIAPIITALAQILAAVLGPVLTIVGALIEALAPIIVALISALMPLIDLLMMVLKPVLDVIVWALQLLADGITWLADVMTDFFSQQEDGTSAAGDAWEGFVGWLTDIWNSVVGFFETVWNSIIGFFEGAAAVATTVWTSVVAFFQMIGAAIAAPFIWFGQMVAQVWASIMTFVQPIVAWFMEHVAPVFQAFGDLVAAIFNYLGSVIAFVWDAIVTAIQGAIDWLVSVIQPIIEAWIGMVVGFFTALWEAIVAVWNGIVDAITTAVKAVSDFIASVWGAILGFVAPIFQAVWSFLSGIFTNIYNFIAGIVKSVVDTVVNVWNSIVGFVSGIFTNVYNAIKDPLQDALDFIMGIKDTIFGFFADAGKWLVDAGKNIIDGLIKGIENALGWLTDVLGGITDMIPKEKGPPAKDKTMLEPAGNLIMQGLINGIREQVPELSNLLGNISSGLTADMQASINGVGDRGGDSRTFNYYAGAGSQQISGQDELMLAMRRSKVVVPGWA